MPRRATIALAGLMLSGCGAGWHHEPATPQTTIPPRKQVRVYHGASVERWHAVRIGADSITGIHWLAPIETDTGRVALPLRIIDSLQVGDPSEGFRHSAALTYVGLIAVGVLLCQIGYCGD